MRKRNILLTAKQAPVPSAKAKLESEEDFFKKSPKTAAQSSELSSKTVTSHFSNRSDLLEKDLIDC